ncbi:MAG: hypothetical protein UY06_C0008G0002 [Candidatus Amesbacteria bacterium GW2011_GWA2_47_70]|nr:MAG: hypothetical protein UX93_C0007G0003 [Microgenomates group bacterium GW2011_GWC1_47_20]KKU79991.1 MAG: hypothetical protein UY06_C0008G0002 [Candidatus Amesbacteria bacterium GW2011_GWA2_47_70]
MEYLILKFGVGVGMLLLSTHAFVKLVIKISQRLKLSPLIIGMTVVAVGTSLPELVVSGTSLIKGDVGLAWGNIIGSNIVNVLLVLPVGIMLGKLRIGTTKTQRNVWVLLGAAAIFAAIQAWGWSGWILLVLAVAVIIEEYMWGVAGREHEDAKRFNHLAPKKLGAGDGIGILVTLVVIAVGGVMTVGAVEGISLASGYSTTILGLTLTAVVTSLPELLTTVFAQKEHQAKVTVGNIVGSNIYNLLLIGGILLLFSSPLALGTREVVWLGLTTAIFALILHKFSGKPVPRWVGAGLLGLLVVYLLVLR